MTDTVLHVSDSLVGGAEKNVDDEAPLGGLSSVVQLATNQGVDAVVHSGNLFRRPDPTPELVERVASALSELQSADIPFFIVGGQRESYSDGDSFGPLLEQGLVQKLTSEPTQVGDIALYGIDYADSEERLCDRLDELEPASSYTYNVVVTHQAIWPPAGKGAADISSFDFLNATDVHVGMVLAGGLTEPRVWEHDDFEYRVTYPGTTNPHNLSSGGIPNGTLLEADSEGASHERVPLRTSTADDELTQFQQALEITPSETQELDIDTLVDLYGLAARAKSRFEDRRTTIRDELLARLDGDGHFEGQYASVDRETHRRRTVKSEETVRPALQRNDIDPATVMKLDSSALRELVDEGELSEQEIFEITHRGQVRLDSVSL